MSALTSDSLSGRFVFACVQRFSALAPSGFPLLTPAVFRYCQIVFPILFRGEGRMGEGEGNN
jgi:hypothetical protein